MSPRPRSDAMIVWFLTLPLAALFIVTGGAKLVGTTPVGFEAAGMAGFPEWIRMVVGAVEVAGAVALLVPALSALAAAMLALLMIPATITQLVSGQAGALVPVVVLAVLLVLAWRRAPDAARSAYDAAVRTPRPLTREGVIVGGLGATVIVVWFLGVDVAAGRPLFTPATLGRATLAIFVPGLDTSATWVPVLAYTVLHYAAFFAIGSLAALIVRAAHHEPSILIGFFVLLVAMEVGFYAFVGLLQQATALGTLAWYNVMIGNLLAVGAMGFLLLRRHPALRAQFRGALDAPAAHAHP